MLSHLLTSFVTLPILSLRSAGGTTKEPSETSDERIGRSVATRCLTIKG